MADNIEQAVQTVELPRATEEDLKALEYIAVNDRTIADIIGTTLVSVVRELRARRQTEEIQQADLERIKQDTTNALALVAQMHAACVGDSRGPRAGWIQDIANLRTYAMQTRIALDACVELTEKHEERIEKLRDANSKLGTIALSLANPRDQVEQQRIKALVKVGADDQQAQTPTLVRG